MVWALCWLHHVVTYPLVINPKQPTAKVLYTTNIDTREKMMKNSNCSFTFTKTTLSALHMDRRFIQRTSVSLVMSYCFVMVPGLSEFLRFSVNIAEFGSLFGFYSSRFFFFIIPIEINILWCWWHWILFLLIFFCCFVILCFHSCFHCKSNTLNFKTLYIFTEVQNTLKSNRCCESFIYATYVYI